MGDVAISRADIDDLQSSMEALPDDLKFEPELKHYFGDGIYAREIFLPAGTTIVGKIHNARNINIVSQGKCKLVTELGEKIIEAPFTMETTPGIKRAVHAITDVVWTTLLATEETDVEKIESQAVTSSYEEYNARIEGGKQCHLER